MTWPFRSDRLHAQLPLAKINVAPFERHHLAAPQPRFPTQQHDQVGVRVRLRGVDQTLVILDPRSKATSVVLTEEGERLARELLRRHFGRRVS